MIPYKDQIKIRDFREAYRKIMNPNNNNNNVNDIIDALFYNVECNYEEYQSAVPYVSASKEQYKYHILQPVNGRYSLLDFLLNRAISNVDCIRPCNENAYDHRKALFINTHRYEQYRSKYSEEFIEQQYYKSRLHETGHALHVWDTKKITLYILFLMLEIYILIQALPISMIRYMVFGVYLVLNILIY